MIEDKHGMRVTMSLEGCGMNGSNPGIGLNYLNENSPLAQVYSHLVITFKFLMPLIVHVLKGNFATYELSKDVLRIIKKGLEDFRLLDNIMSYLCGN